jgi:hypothetical protein
LQVVDSLSQIPRLLEEGEKFTFKNFSSKGSRGYPNALSEDWLVWTHAVNCIVDNFDDGSPAVASIRSGLKIQLLGNGEDSFTSAKQMMMNGLRAAARIFAANKASGEPPVTPVVADSGVPSESSQKVSVVTNVMRAGEDAAALHGEMLRRIAAVEIAIERLSLPPAGIGHNRPPEPIESSPLSGAEIGEIERQIDIVKMQPPLPKQLPIEARQAADKLKTFGEKILAYCGKQADTFITEVVKSAGKALPIWALFGEELIALSTSISHWLSALTHLVQ